MRAGNSGGAACDFIAPEAVGTAYAPAGSRHDPDTSPISRNAHGLAPPHLDRIAGLASIAFSLGFAIAFMNYAPAIAERAAMSAAVAVIRTVGG
jgi:hypothetical protein